MFFKLLQHALACLLSFKCSSFSIVKLKQALKIFIIKRINFHILYQLLASHAGVSRGAHISSLRTNAEGRNASSPKNACVGGWPIVEIFCRLFLLRRAEKRLDLVVPSGFRTSGRGTMNITWQQKTK